MSEPKHHSETQGEYRKYRKQTGHGKGDKRRPGDEKLFQKNFDEIDWHRTTTRLCPRCDFATTDRLAHFCWNCDLEFERED
jgi:hypothetical protein